AAKHALLDAPAETETLALGQVLDQLGDTLEGVVGSIDNRERVHRRQCRGVLAILAAIPARQATHAHIRAFSLPSGAQSATPFHGSAGGYPHGPYDTFTVRDPKTRLIAVASIRDRLVHRLLYDALIDRFDPVFLYDVWSCRKDKGLHRAIDRAQAF